MTRRPLRVLLPLAVVALAAACAGDDPGSGAGSTSETFEPGFSDEPELAVSTPAPTASPSPSSLPATVASTAAPSTAAPTIPPTIPPTVPATTVPGPPETSCTSVIHVGDSTSVSLISSSAIPDPRLRVDAQYRRVGAEDARTVIDGALSTHETLDGQVNAFDRVMEIKAGGYEGCWVLALGGNDTANVSAVSGGPTRMERIDRMMSAIGDDPVMWVNVKTLRDSGAYRNENMLLWNDALRQALPKYPNMRIFDWASVVQDQWFEDDAIHYTPDGSVMRGTLIADALAANFPA